MYDKFPSISVPGGLAAECWRGWSAVCARICSAAKQKAASSGRFVIAVECYTGLHEKEVHGSLIGGLAAQHFVESRDALKTPAEIEELIAPYLGGDDPIFGYYTPLTLQNFLDPARLAAVRQRISQLAGIVVVYGPAALLCCDPDLIIYADMPRWEGQLRQRRNEVCNLGVSNHELKSSLQYKRSFFVDWRVCDRLKEETIGRWDYLLDTTVPEDPKLISGNAMRAALDAAVRRPIRVVPFFDPAPWGGQWLKERFSLDPSQSNYGWGFDCVPEENSLLLDFAGTPVEIPSLNLVLYRPRQLLGDAVFRKFGAEFPIRFDLLDTMAGGNLSLQVHPMAEYARKTFGLSYTQDESYYILDGGVGASVFLGLQSGVKPDEMIAALRDAQAGTAPFPAEKFTAQWPAKKHDHFLIPAGTVHCSGANAVVLEISATPYIFTFKLWDWGRLGLDGQPRPINIDHGKAVIQWDRDAQWAGANLINHLTPLSRGPGWREERTNLHPLEFIETRRHWFTAATPHRTQGSVNVLNLVEGEEALIESPQRAFEPFIVHYAETFIVPAAVGPYTIRPHGAAIGTRCGTIKAIVVGGNANEDHPKVRQRRPRRSRMAAKMGPVRCKFVAGLLIAISAALPARHAAAAPQSDDVIGFNRSIRPLLSDRCFACHGPDSVQRKAGIRFDRPDSLFGPLPKDPDKRAFVPGKPQESEAYRRITTSDSDEVMPPAKSHLKLNAQEKETIRKWIEQGAHWEQFWAFIPPVRPALPEVKDASWPKNDIDRFILARLESEGLHPSPEADKAALIRRVSLALTGLPPTLAEVDAFMADNSPDAYEKVVDRLLASPRYGEEMASRWLDYARYADSHGYQSDPERHMWRWRDWVINAYNKNMPFDEFTTEQLAGDLLPNATIDHRIATGFNRNHRINSEGGIIAEEWRVEGVIDRAETTGAVWLGLTVGCCRCHDHKFDPITQKDFYSFCGFFNNVHESGVGDTLATDKGINIPPVLKLPTPDQTKKLAELAAKLDASKARLAELEKRAPQLMEAWEEEQQHRGEPQGLVASFRFDGQVQGTAADGKPIDTGFHDGAGATTQPSFVQGVSGQKAIKFDGKDTAVDAGQAVNFESTDAFSYGARVNIHRQESGCILCKMDDTKGFRGFDLFVDNGKLAVHVIHQWTEDSIKVVTDAAIPKDKWVSLLATYDGSKKAAGVKIYLDGALQPVHFDQDHLTATIKTTVPLLIGKRPTSSPFSGKVADVVFFNRVLTPQEAADVAFGPDVRSILAIAPEQRSAAQKKQLEEDFRAGSPEISLAKGEIASTTASIDELNKQVADTMVMEDQPAKRENFVLIRGQYDKHGEVVPTGVPAVFGQLAADQPPNRLGLARWIVDPANPLTGRVLANRLWEKYFGAGLVKTSENMGTQSEPPSHRELLDWLATELVGDHWDLKKFQKLIVMSAAYRQSSATTPELIERDPENRLLAHGPRFRLSAEEIRDQALAASGLLVEKVGGPSVRPYEPANLWSGNLYGNLSQYVPDKGEALYRRSIYSFLKRTATPPNLTEFDMPSREYCVIKRSRTDTPLQALDLMDDLTYVEASRVLGEHMMTDGGSTPADRISYCFRRLTARPPTSMESRILLDGFERQLAHYQSDPASAAKFVSVGDNPRDTSLDASELAAYTMTASVILNLDETINLP